MESGRVAGTGELRSRMYHIFTCFSGARKSGSPRTGAGITCPGGHGTEYGTRVRTVDGPGDAETFVDAYVNEGSDYIKIIYTPDSQRFRSISHKTLQASVEA